MSPAGESRPGNAGLLAKIAALAALTATIVTVTVKQTSPASTAAQLGCPAAAPSAVVIRFANATSAGFTRDTVTPPVVVCGPEGMAYNLQAHPEAGHGPLAVLSPPDTAASRPLVSIGLVNTDSPNRWVVQMDDLTALSREGLYDLASNALLASRARVDSAQLANYSLPLTETADSVSRWIGNRVLFFRPARGTRPRTQLVENAGACWAGDPWVNCQANGGTRPASTVNGWMATWLNGIISPTVTVLDLTVTRTDTSFQWTLPSLSAP